MAKKSVPFVRYVKSVFPVQVADELLCEAIVGLFGNCPEAAIKLLYAAKAKQECAAEMQVTLDKEAELQRLEALLNEARPEPAQEACNGLASYLSNGR